MSSSGAAAAAAASKEHSSSSAHFSVSGVPPAYVLLNPLAWLLWGLDFAVWAGSLVGPYRWLTSGLGRLSRVIGEATRVSALNAPGVNTINLVPGEEEIRTCHDLMQRNFRRFGRLRAFGTREYLGEYSKPGTRGPALKLFGETSWQTYAEVQTRARRFGLGLRKLGLQPQPTGRDFESLPPGHSLLLWEDTSADWMTALIAAGGQSIAVATSYASLGVEAVVEAINEVGCRVVVCNYRSVAKLVELKARCPVLETIIFTYVNVERSLRSKAPVDSLPSGLRALSMDAVVETGAEDGDYSPPTPDTMAVIMYTSGSTGKPKGVMIKHRSFVASVAGMNEWVKNARALNTDGGEAYLAYLPAAHILELVAEHSMMSIGAELGFSDPRTITSRGAARQTPSGEVRTTPGYPYPPGGLQEFRPSLMAGVPKIWDIFKKGIEEQIGRAGPVARFVFQVAFSGRYAALQQGRESPLFKLVFSRRVQPVVGGRLRIGLTGGGACASNVQSFIRTALAIPFVQGYALTETCCAGTIQYLSDRRNGVVGPPLASVMMRLHSCPDINDHSGKPYLASDTSHNGVPCAGRGEVWVTGDSLTDGYFKQKDKTDEAYVRSEGHRWFRTGDIACWTLDGSLRIVDRLKNLLKLKGGEYIAVEHMEAVYNTAPVVDALNGGVMIYGDGDMDRAIAFVQVVVRQVEDWGKSEGISFDSPQALCENPKAEAWVTAQLNAVGKKGGLAALESLAGVKLFAGTGDKARTPAGRHDPWTPENGMLTPTNKVNRKPIESTFKSILNDAKHKYGIFK